MSDYNRVGLIGRLTKDVELKWTSAQKAYVDCSIAVRHWSRKTDDEGKKKEDEKKKDDDVSFFEVRAWGHTAEFLAKNCGKGARILVDGYLRQHRWEGKEGEKRTRVVVYCQSVQLLASRTAREGETGENSGREAMGYRREEEELLWEGAF